MHKFGCNKVKKDFRDYKVKAVGAKKLPSSYRINKSLLIKDQGMVNSCVAHSLSSFEESVYNKNFSTNFIYGYRPSTYYQGEGMDMRDALHTLIKYGDCLNEIYPGNTEVVEVYDETNRYATEYVAAATPYKMKSYARIYTVKQIKEILLKDIPVPISIPVKTDLHVKNNVVQYNKDEEITGYHAVLIIGYTEQGYIIQNSWGIGWGDKGTAILPYDYPINSAWAININDKIIIKEPMKWFAIICNFIINLFKRR